MRSFLMGALFLCASQGFAAEYLVKYKNQKAFDAVYEMASMKSTGLRVLGEHVQGSYLKIDLDDAAQVTTLAQLVSNPDVEWVTENFTLHTFEAPVDKATLQTQWAIAKVNAERAWTRAGNRGNHNVVVAVIDTGVDYKHKNLASNMVPGYDFNGKDADPMDEVGSRNPGHGTHCSGIIAADGTVDGGTIGMAPGVSLMPIRFLGKDGQGSLDDGIKAIDYAIEHHVQVISASWGAAVKRPQATALIEAVKRADDAGVIFVAAAANDGSNNDTREVFPANAGWPNTITVAASGATDAKPSWSNYGTTTVHLASPGEAIMSTLPDDKYGNLSGTSMATPLVSGLVAFLKSQDPSLTGAQIRALLQATGAQVNIQTACNCRVDAFAAVDALLNKTMWIVPDAATIGNGEAVTLQVMNGQAPFTFTSSDPAVISVDPSGVVKAGNRGVATITVTDASGKVAKTLNFNATGAAGTPPTPPAEGCWLGARTCNVLCRWMPHLRWCKKP